MTCQPFVAQIPAISFNHLQRDEELFSSNFFSLMEDSRGFIWFGSLGGGGLYRFDGYNVRSFTANPENSKGSLSFVKVFSIYPVNDTLFYIGTYFGYSTLNPVTGRIRSYQNIDDSGDPWQNVFYQFLQDSIHHTLWIGTAKGLGKLDHNTDVFQWANPVLKNGSIQPDIKITALIKNPFQEDILFLGGPHGLYKYFIADNRIEHIAIPGLNDAGNYISSLSLDNKNNLWVGIHSNTNLYRYDIAREEWSTYTIPRSSQNPDATFVISKILPEKDSSIWIAAFSHIGVLKPSANQFQVWEYNSDNPTGLLPNHHYIDLISDRHGKLWVASWSGIQYSDQVIMAPSKAVNTPHVAITGLDIKPIITEREKPLLYSGQIELQQEQRDLTFHYVLPNPRYPSNVVYQYRLKGYDNDWIQTDQRIVRYGKLSGGNYQFLIKAQDGRDGMWTPVTSLSIDIPKKITELFWFWALFGLTFIGSGSIAFKYIIRRSKNEAILKSEFQRQLSEIQMQALRAQMNPHFLFNSLNSIKYFAISKSKEETAAYVSKFALLVRTILTNSKSKTISLQDELDALRLYIEIEHLRLEGTFDYEIEIDSSIHLRKVQIPPMILQPYVENAIWHGFMEKEEGGKLHIYVQDMGRQIQCRIEDNGIGRVRAAELRKKQSMQRKSEGMQITSDRIALINRIYHIHTEVDIVDLYHPDGSAAGTRVVIHIPQIREEEE